MVMHAEMKIGESVIMLSEENCEQGQKSPVTLGGSATHVFLYVPDVDASFAQAIAAGATAIMPPMNMFWGDRFGKLKDPYGHEWSMASHVEDVTPEEMGKRMAEMFAGDQPRADRVKRRRSHRFFPCCSSRPASRGGAEHARRAPGTARSASRAFTATSRTS
jgi:hypothetical protein